MGSMVHCVLSLIWPYRRGLLMISPVFCDFEHYNPVSKSRYLFHPNAPNCHSSLPAGEKRGGGVPKEAFF
jgi:hypothetical protein